MPGGRVGRVERERAAQDHPGEVARSDVDELARRASPLASSGAWIRLEPLARQDLPTVDELRRREPHRHAVGSSSVVVASAVASPRASASSLGRSARRLVGSPPVPSPSPASSGATAGNASARASARSPKTSVGS